ncbi:ATP-grasp domain-containing protein [Thiocystis violacea]|uniref:ATP-grasp domain-containing protein n=1 Tax=Thiocystis violacea TaxID=13725 RepID=UPI001907F485|nr:RimK family alpha-L-glutamate ligase [Thiocystis violacea]MBK1722639.1 RimK family alpha-L-glutamate ligase [Thiocystis violacea]
MQPALGLAVLLRHKLSGADLAPLYQALIQKATADPREAGALLDAAVILQFSGNAELALKLQQEALRVTRHYGLPVREPVRLRLLALMAPGGLMANVPIECLLEDSDIQLDIVYVTGEETDSTRLPDHDVLFVAVGESEANRSILATWARLLADWRGPVINRPERIMAVARDTAAGLLHGRPGIEMPRTWALSREAVAAIATQLKLPEDMDFPCILRPRDSHAGHDLCKLDTQHALAERLESMPGNDFYLSRFVDYRSTDGLFRKYRIVLIAGRPFACHMGISSRWMIHYLNADMEGNPANRAEEARFMETFDEAFAIRHQDALSTIHHTMGLDYLGIDCAETQDGRLLVFEVDPAMVVHAMDPSDLYPYKEATMQKVFAAFRAMLMTCALRHQGGEAERRDE